MSPLAILYFLLASSPVYNNWRHESPMSSSLWAFPSTFDNSLESSIFGGEFSNLFNNKEWMTPESSSFFGRNVESTRFNWLLRKALRTCPVTGLSTRRNFVNELFGLRHESPIFSMIKSIESPIKMIERIAKVNPILIEKLLTRPESRFALESVLRTVEPESLLLVEKLIRKNVPVYLREKIARRVIKSLLTKSTLSTPRHSIVSELYPTMTTPFSTLFNVEEPTMIKMLIKNVLRHSEVAKIVKKLIKNSIVSRRSIVNEMYPTTFESSTPFSTLFESSTPFSTLFENVEEPMFLNKIVKKALRHAEVRRMIKKLIKKSLIHSHESALPIELLSTLSHVEPKFVAKKIEKVIRRLVKSSVYEPESILSTLSHVEPKFAAKKIEKVIRRLVKSSTYEPESILSTLFSSKKFEKKSPINKIIKSIVKSNVYGEEEIFCNACESICERESFEWSPIMNKNNNKWTKKVCRVCEEVCPTMSWSSPMPFAGRNTFFRPTTFSSVARHFDF